MGKKIIIVLGLILGAVTSSYAALTPISYPTGYNERWLNVNKPDGTLSVLDYLFGANNYVRIDDALDTMWATSSGADVRAVAKYAANSQNLWAGSQNLFSITGDNFASLTSGQNVNLNLPGEFNFLDNSGGVIWSSIPGANPDGLDHMVTFEITNHGGTNYSVGDYVIAWEDLGKGGDYDYNDMVFCLHNISPVVTPEPATMALFGLGLFGLAFTGKKRKQKL
jgi:Domain of unknown function (DUF4114)/PEP-CTERM motif